MGQEISLSENFNRTREGYHTPPWFVFSHDIVPQDVRLAISFISNQKLNIPASYAINNPEEKDPFSALYLYIYHRIGIVCPELIRVNLEVDEDASISFLSYKESGIKIGNSLFTLIFDTILQSLAQINSSVELHCQACHIVRHMSDNCISASVFLEVVNTVISAVLLFTDINMEDPGIIAICRVFFEFV